MNPIDPARPLIRLNMTQQTAIAVFCFNRASKLHESMQALLANPEVAGMDVVFFCDGPRHERDEPGVQAVRTYIDGLTGFGKVIRKFRPKNLSTGPNFQEGITWMSRQYQQFIVVEDDLVVTPNYIRYMLDALQFYQAEQGIFCISGFAFPLRTHDYAYDTAMHTRFCSYGWAIWSNRVESIRFGRKDLQDMVEHSPGFRDRLNREGRDLYRMLKKQISGAISTWDIQMQVHVAEHQLKVVYPVISKTHNIGFDNESTNTFGVDYLKTVTDPGEKRSFRFCPADTQNPGIVAQLRKPYSLFSLASRKLMNTVIQLTGSVKKAEIKPVQA